MSSANNNPAAQLLSAFAAAIYVKDVEAFVAQEWFGKMGDELVLVEADHAQLTLTPALSFVSAFVKYTAVSSAGKSLRSLQNRLTWMLEPKSEGWAKSLHGQTIDANSAGTSPHSVNPLAIKAMAEVGIDISRHESKHLNSLNHLQFDLVITVCDNAASSCPIPPKGARVVHVPFEDPPQLAKDAKSEEDALQHYRRVRDEIRHFISKLPSLFTPENMEVNR